MANDIKHRFEDMITIDAAKFRIKFKDYHHLKNTYIMMHEWMIEEGYATREDQDFGEELYMQREYQNAGSEIVFWWRLKKTPHGNSYIRWILDLDVHVIEYKEVEVMHAGQKFKTSFGELEVDVAANLEIDYQKTWRNHWFLKHFNKIFYSRIYKRNVDMHRLAFYRESYRFQEALKTFLQLRTFLPEPELSKFVPNKGLGEPQ